MAKTDSSASATGTSGGGNRAARTVARVRGLVAQVVWMLFLAAALFLAVAALLIALKANEQNDLVQFVLDGADRVDLGIFGLTDGIKQFGDPNAEVKNALFNYGLGAVAWLVVGRILDKLIRP